MWAGDGTRARSWPLLVIPVAMVMVMAAAGAGCVGFGMSGEVPRWAMHVRPAAVDFASTPDQIADRVARELASPTLATGHVPAEQLAWLAIREIEQRQLADAGLWLALADYRYYQQAKLAQTKGLAEVETLPASVNQDAYVKLVVAEIRLYADIGFDDELNAINTRLWGRSEEDVALHEQLLDLGKTKATDHVSLRDAIAELRPGSDTTAAVSRYPQLAEAFRRRLIDDFTHDPQSWAAAHYLAQTPIAALRQQAVLQAARPFLPRVCSAVASSFPSQRPAIVKALAHPRPEVRANAAAALGLAPTQETRALVEARLPVEPDARVKLALAFSLFHHGAPEHLATLTRALATCTPSTCVLPTSLVDWLPMAAKADLDQAPLARIVSDTRIDIIARFFAAATLRDIGSVKPLDPPTVEALLIAARGKGKDEYVRDVAIRAIENAESLSRPDVIARLQGRSAQPGARNDQMFPAPLLARLAKVSTAADLPLLKQMMDRFGDHDGPEAHYVVDAALNVGGQAPNTYLNNWFIRYRRLQTHIGLGLAERDGFPRVWLDRLLAHGDARTRIVVKLVRRDADAATTLHAYLQRGDIDEKFQASSVAWLAGRTDVKAPLLGLVAFQDARYYPHDALVRHAAMMSLVRLALLSSRPPTTTTPTTPTPAAPSTPAAPAAP
jgi:hypothetical protein